MILVDTLFSLIIRSGWLLRIGMQPLEMYEHAFLIYKLSWVKLRNTVTRFWKLQQAICENGRSRSFKFQKFLHAGCSWNIKICLVILLIVFTYVVQVRLQKAVYHTLNLFTFDSIGKFFVAECWVPLSDLENVRQALERAVVGLYSIVLLHIFSLLLIKRKIFLVSEQLLFRLGIMLNLSSWSLFLTRSTLKSS